jgi:hypothetical protein
MMDHVRVASEFSPKRFKLFVKTIKEICPASSHACLINVCKTRWVARIDGLSVFIEIFLAVVNVESTRKACYLFILVTSFPFIVTLVVVSKCLEVTRRLTVQLQESAIDPGAAREKVSGLYVHLEKVRNMKWIEGMTRCTKKQSLLQVQLEPSHTDQE